MRRYFLVEKPLSPNRWRFVAKCEKRSDAEAWIARMGSPEWRIREVQE